MLNCRCMLIGNATKQVCKILCNDWTVPLQTEEWIRRIRVDWSKTHDYWQARGEASSTRRKNEVNDIQCTAQKDWSNMYPYRSLYLGLVPIDSLIADLGEFTSLLSTSSPNDQFPNKGFQGVEKIIYTAITWNFKELKYEKAMYHEPTENELYFAISVAVNITRKKTFWICWKEKQRFTYLVQIVQKTWSTSLLSASGISWSWKISLRDLLVLVYE